jgi:hypothetical protein
MGEVPGPFIANVNRDSPGELPGPDYVRNGPTKPTTGRQNVVDRDEL